MPRNPNAVLKSLDFILSAGGESSSDFCKRALWSVYLESMVVIWNTKCSGPAWGKEISKTANAVIQERNESSGYFSLG